MHPAAGPVDKRPAAFTAWALSPDGAADGLGAASRAGYSATGVAGGTGGGTAGSTSPAVGTLEQDQPAQPATGHTHAPCTAPHND
jgi:hypothetical protein